MLNVQKVAVIVVAIQRIIKINDLLTIFKNWHEKIFFFTTCAMSAFETGSPN